MDLYKFLHSTTVQDLIRSNSKYDDLIYINTQTTVESCLEILVSKDILSVPVLAEKTRNFVGILDISQIMNFIVFASYEPGSIPTLDNMLKKQIYVKLLLVSSTIPICAHSIPLQVSNKLSSGSHKAHIDYSSLTKTQLQLSLKPI